MGEDQERQPSNFLRDFYEALRSGLQSSLPSLPNPTSPLAKEAMAHQDLARAGSVMAKPQEADWKRNNPLLGTLADVTNFAGGMADPVDMFGGKPLKLAAKLGIPSAVIDMLGFRDPAAENAGIFRNLGLDRQIGRYNPAEFAAILMEHPRYARFKQLTENLARRNLGEKFKVYRGGAVSDPLFRRPTTTKELPTATSVSLNPRVAHGFATPDLESPQGRLAHIEATPESLLSFLPRRGSSFKTEEELIMDPRWASKIKIFKDSSSAPSASATADPLLSSTIEEVLSRYAAKGRPIPGAGSKKDVGKKFDPDTLGANLSNIPSPWAESVASEIPGGPSYVPSAVGNKISAIEELEGQLAKLESKIAGMSTKMPSFKKAGQTIDANAPLTDLVADLKKLLEEAAVPPLKGVNP